MANDTDDAESSEEENLELLKEATDSQFINDDMFKEKKEHSKSIAEKLPSLRQNNIENDYDLIEISQETRSYIGKKLSEVLDNKLSNLLSYKNQSDEDPSNKKVKSRVKLFHDSKHYIKLEKPQTIVYKRTFKDMEDNEENCKEVAISGADILNQEEVKHWSTRTKAKVFKYKMNGKGTLIETSQ